MDISTLSMRMEKDPKAYDQEYKKQVQSFIHLMNLQKQPEKLIRQTVDLLVRYTSICPDVPYIILQSIPKCKTYKLKIRLISVCINLSHKKILKEGIIKMILDEIPDCTKYINDCKTLITDKYKNLLIEYYTTGTDKQKLFCYYFLCNTNTSLELVCSGLFQNQGVRKYCYKYFIENITSNSITDNLSGDVYKYGILLYKEIINKKDEREYVILKMKVYNIFRKCYQYKQSIIPQVISMMDVEKKDIKDLMEIIVDSVLISEVEEVIKIVYDNFCNPHKDVDMICYGLNFLGRIYKKIIGLEDIEDDKKDDELCVYGDKETIEGNMEGKEQNTITTFINIKEQISNQIDCFKGDKSKSVQYAYKGLVNVLRGKKGYSREHTKKMTKEERREKYTKNEKKEMESRKSNRKWRLSKKIVRKKRKQVKK